MIWHIQQIKTKIRIFAFLFFSARSRVLHLCSYDDCSISLDKSTRRIMTCRVIWRGAGSLVNLLSQLVKLTSLSSGTCHRVNKTKQHTPQVGFVTYEKDLLASAGNFFFGEAFASEKVFARFVGPFFVCCSLSKKRVFGWTRCEIWPCHHPPSTSFSLYKQSRSDTGSTQKIGINKERESERFSHQRCRTSQRNCWLWTGICSWNPRYFYLTKICEVST